MSSMLSRDDLAAGYRAYIHCLNGRKLADLGRFVCDDVHHNGRLLGLSGYREMLEDDFRAIPDLHFDIRLLVCEPPYAASRLHFNCTPTATLFGHHVNGKRVQFDENVFYEFEKTRIARVWSVIDKAAIASQL